MTAEKDWTNVTWTMPRWAAKLFWDTLQAEAENVNLNKQYREEMDSAMNYVCEAEVSATPLLDEIGKHIDTASLVRASHNIES